MGRELTHLDLLTAAADEAEDDLRSVVECARSVEERVERMTRTVIARLHHYKLLGQAVP